MQSAIKKLLARLSPAQKLTIVLVALLITGGILYLVRWQREADFKPLFTGLAAEDAAGIVQKLREGGVEYRLPDGGGAVLVPSAKLAELRLTMAAAGLPKTGRIGFELFDKTNLGATEFTEHVNFRRALEGELERSVVSLAEVAEARVHLTFPKDSVFLDAQQPAKASVMVRIKPGSRLSPQNVMAIDHLVASAVEGLSPDAVSVLDMNGNLLGKPRAQGGLDGPEPSEAALDYRHKLEQELLAKVNATLEPLLGAEKFRTGVSIECDFSGIDQSEEIFDPARSVMATSERTEDTSGNAASSGVPGTQSALPRPTSRGTSGNRTSRVTENITYQTSRTVKKTRLPAGSVRRMSLSVLVDQDVQWVPEKNGWRKVLVPPGPDRLKALHDLVAGIAGLNTDRGDQLIIETLPFENTLLLEPPPDTKPAIPNQPKPFALPLGTFHWDRKMIPIASGAAVLLGLLGFGLRFVMMRRRARKAKATVPVSLPGAAGNAPVKSVGAPVSQEQIESQLAERDALQQKMEAEALNALKLSPVITKAAEVMAKHLRERIKQEPDLSAQILRTWIREEEG